MANCNGCLKDNINGFCSACETKLFDRSKVPNQLEFNWNDIQDRIMGQPAGFSISGVQAKGFIGRDKNNLLAPNRDTESMYIIKPFLDSRRNLHLDSPANEHLTMTMADQLFNISTAKCAYVKFANGKPAYLTRRFDRDKEGNVLRQEDFVSVLNATPNPNDHGLYKYNSFTYEDVGNRLNPADQIRFIRILVFNFLTGNGDVHLKNLSLLESADGDMLLSPSYDLMNTKLHINDSEIAMNLFKEMERTKQNLLTATYDYKIGDFVELGRRIGVRDRILLSIEKEFSAVKEDMLLLVDKSFLSEVGKIRYKEEVELHYKKLFTV
ncbi:MAG: HipA domain-containing protein [Bacteroidales bacterium]|nr:HipA domain-containing protein [Bacteroidales bacterium]